MLAAIIRFRKADNKGDIMSLGYFIFFFCIDLLKKLRNAWENIARSIIPIIEAVFISE